MVPVQLCFNSCLTTVCHIKVPGGTLMWQSPFASILVDDLASADISQTYRDVMLIADLAFIGINAMSVI